MTNEILNKFLSIQDTLKRRNIRQPSGYPFQTGWTDKLIRSFAKAVPAPVSITYKMIVWLENRWYDGEIEITRDGNLIVRLAH